MMMARCKTVEFRSDSFATNCHGRIKLAYFKQGSIKGLAGS